MLEKRVGIVIYKHHLSAANGSPEGSPFGITVFNSNFTLDIFWCVWLYTHGSKCTFLAHLIGRCCTSLLPDDVNLKLSAWISQGNG